MKQVLQNVPNIVNIHVLSCRFGGSIPLSVMLWILIGYMWLAIHRPFEVWPILGAFRIERIYMLFTIICWLMFSPKQLNTNKVHIGIACIGLSMFISSTLSPIGSGGMDFFNGSDWWKYAVFYFLFTSTLKTEKELKTFVTAYVVIFFVYLAHSYREFLCGAGYYAMGVFRMVGVAKDQSFDPNFLCNMIVCTLPFLIPVMTLFTKKWQYLAALAALLLSLRSVQMTGSRSGFFVFTIGILTAAMFSKHRVRIFLILAMLTPVIWNIMPKENQDRIATLWDPSRGPRNAEASARGRWIGFVTGVGYWMQYPLAGVGPGAIQHMPGSATGTLQTHCLYGQVPGELGTLGVAAYLFLISCYVTNHIQAYLIYQRLQKLGRGKDALFHYRISYATIFGMYMMLWFGTSLHNMTLYAWVYWAGFQSLALTQLQEKLAVAYRDRALGVLSAEPLMKFKAA